MNELEKAAYVLGLKKAIEEIKAEAVWAGMEWSDRPEFFTAAASSLQNTLVLMQDEIAMMEGTRVTKEN